MSRFWKSLGLVGLLSGTALAQDDTGYANMTQPEVARIVQDRSVSLDSNNWKRKVLDYDGAVIVLFHGATCEGERIKDSAKNMEIAYLGLIDKFEEEQVNGLPLKFAEYDYCGDAWVRTVGVTGTQTQMYLDGNKLDWRVGGPKTAETIPNTSRALSDWISSQLLGVPVTIRGTEEILYFEGGSPKFRPY